jgi:hypothetical protein
MMSNTPSDNTAGRDDARRALEESQRANRRADSLINETRRTLAAVANSRDHYTDSLRAIIRGS